MALDFPNSPSVNDSFSAGGKTWVYNGTKWVLLSVSLNQTVADGAITAAKLASDSVTTAKITDANITAAKLASSAVTAAKIASDAVTTAKILDANVTEAKIASDAVTTAKILDANITTAKVAANAITTHDVPWYCQVLSFEVNVSPLAGELGKSSAIMPNSHFQSQP